MSLPVAHSHVCARHALPPQVRCSTLQKQTACGHQRLCSTQRSLSSCSALRGRQLSGHSRQSRLEHKRPAAAARQAEGDDDNKEDEEEEDDEEEQEDDQDVMEEEDDTTERGGRADADRRMMNEEDDGFQERVVQVRRVTKVAKGGKSMAFRAVVVVGDEMGQVGVGCASGKEVVTAVAKAVVQAKMDIIQVPLTSSATFPHKFDGYAGAAKVMLRPASEGTGVIAGGAVRVVLELAGVKNAFGKQLGSQNPLNNARATIAGLREMRTFKDIARTRGLSPQEILNQMTVGNRTTSSAAAAEKYETRDEEDEVEPVVVKKPADKGGQIRINLKDLGLTDDDATPNFDSEWKQLLANKEDAELADAWSKL